MRHNRECRVTITNYCRNGARFLSYLTIIPVRWNSDEYNCSVRSARCGAGRGRRVDLYLFIFSYLFIVLSPALIHSRWGDTTIHLLAEGS